jgi:hypothetical protein
MTAQIENTKNGYVISVYTTYDVGYNKWYPIINFGDRQGDARFFMLYELDKYNESFIRRRIKDFNPKDKYKLEYDDKNMESKILKQ